MYTPSTAPFPFTPARRSGRERAAINRLTLPKGSLVSVTRPQARTVECTHGLVWITHDNESHDIFLSAGQRYVPTSNARMIVQALEKSDFRIQTPQETNLAVILKGWAHPLSALWAGISPARQAATATR